MKVGQDLWPELLSMVLSSPGQQSRKKLKESALVVATHGTPEKTLVLVLLGVHIRLNRMQPPGYLPDCSCFGCGYLN